MKDWKTEWYGSVLLCLGVRFEMTRGVNQRRVQNSLSQPNEKYLD
jgi:hypothetical protein